MECFHENEKAKDRSEVIVGYIVTAFSGMIMGVLLTTAGARFMGCW